MTLTTTTSHRDRTLTGRARTLLAQLWRASPPLTAVAAVMLAAAAASAIGMLVDPRTIAGAPAWLKPFKFAASTAVYSLTLAWIFTYLPERHRVRRIVGWTTAIVFVLEVAIIAAQAARGTISHFNAATPLDQTLYGIMGAAILVQTAVSVSVAVVLWRHRFVDQPSATLRVAARRGHAAAFDQPLGWALRFGMVLTIAGAMTGPLMTRPTPTQLTELSAGAKPTAIGAHTVGGPDGGPGLPVVGWSREHGDVRIAHFVGLHALQVLALVAIATRRWRRPEAARVKAVLAGTASYAALFALLLWQALLGHSLAAAGASLAIWAVATLLTFGAVIAGARWSGRRRNQGPGAVSPGHGSLAARRFAGDIAR